MSCRPGGGTGSAAPPPASHPRCPFSVHGLDDPEMAGCPGYSPQLTAVGADRIVGHGLSCAHLRAQRDPRRAGAFVPACMHPTLVLPVEPRVEP